MPIKHLQLLFAVIVAVVISTLSSVGISHYRSLKKAADRALILEGITRTTTEIQTDGDLAKGISHTFQIDLLRGEQDFLFRQTEGEKNDEAVVSRADKPVPVSVRNNFKARRLARERSQRAALERLGSPEAESSAER